MGGKLKNNPSKIGLLILLLSGVCCADQAFLVKCDVSGQLVVTTGIKSTTKVEQTFPGCSVLVFIHGSTTKASIFSDNGITSLSNPFNTPSIGLTPGQQLVYAANGRYDFVISGAGMTSPITIADVLLNDFANSAPLGFCTVPFSATPTFNAAAGCNIFFMVLTGNVTSSAYTGATAGQQAIFLLQQDSGGSHTFAWPPTMVDTPSINQTANTFTNLYFVADGVPSFHLIGGGGSGGGVLIGSSVVNGAGTVTIPSSGTSVIQPNSTTMIASTCAANQFGIQITSLGVFNCAAVITAFTAASHQFVNAVSVGGVFSAAQPSLSDISAGTAGSGTYDFSGSTVMKIPVASGFFGASNGTIGQDSNTGMYHGFGNTGDRGFAFFLTPSLLTSGDCIKLGQSGPLFGLLDNGGPCPSTIATVTHDFLTSYSALTGTFSQAQPGFSDISGTVAASQLPNPTASTLGGVKALTSVSHNFLTQIDATGTPAQAQPAAGDITAGSNGQCIITSGGVSTWGSCSGTAGVQTIATPNTSAVTVSSAVSTNQTLMTQAIGGAGAINTLGASFNFSGWGNIVAVNNTETIFLTFNLTSSGGSAGATTLMQFTPTTAGFGSGWRGTVSCTVTTTGVNGQVMCSNDAIVQLTSSTFQVGAPATVIIGPIDLTGTITAKYLISFSTASSSNSATQTYMVPLKIQ